MNEASALVGPLTLASSRRAASALERMAYLQREVYAFRAAGREDLATEREAEVVGILGDLSGVEKAALVLLVVRSFTPRLKLCDQCCQRLTDGEICDGCWLGPTTGCRPQVPAEIADTVTFHGAPTPTLPASPPTTKDRAS